jgi:hypothetical protein
LIFENPDGDVLVDLANLQHRVVADAYYLFTQAKHEKHYFISIMGELQTLS